MKSRSFGASSPRLIRQGRFGGSTFVKRNASLIVLLLAFCFGAWLLLRPKPAPPPVLLHPTAHQVAETEKHLNALSQTAAKPGRRPRTLRLSEQDINVALAGSRPLQTLLTAHGVHAVQIVLSEPRRVTIHATAAVHGQTQNIQIDGTLAPDPKTGLRFVASGAQVGSLPLPAPLVSAEAGHLADHFARQFLRRASLSVQEVYVQKDALVIVGIPTASAAPASAAPAFPPTASPARH